VVIRRLGGGISGSCRRKGVIVWLQLLVVRTWGVQFQAYLPLASISPCTATSRGTSPPIGGVVCESGICEGSTNLDGA